MEDADSAAAINNQTGFISECARSFWTPLPSTADTYWAFREKDYIAQNTFCSAQAGTLDFQLPRRYRGGKGAQAHQLRASSTRAAMTAARPAQLRAAAAA